MLAPIINSVGLVLDIAGAILIMIFGLPAKIDREGHRGLLLEGTDHEQIAKAKRYDRRTRIGLVCLVIGFLFQLLSNWVR
jgi:hypothetical protein